MCSQYVPNVCIRVLISVNRAAAASADKKEVTCKLQKPAGEEVPRMWHLKKSEGRKGKRIWRKRGGMMVRRRILVLKKTMTMCRYCCPSCDMHPPPHN